MSGTTCLASGFLTEDSQIYVGRGTLNAVTTVSTATEGTTTVLIYDTDQSAPSGKIVFATIIGVGQTLPAAFNLAVRCEKGLYATITGDGGYVVYYGA